MYIGDFQFDHDLDPSSHLSQGNPGVAHFMDDGLSFELGVAKDYPAQLTVDDEQFWGMIPYGNGLSPGQPGQNGPGQGLGDQQPYVYPQPGHGFSQVVPLSPTVSHLGLSTTACVPGVGPPFGTPQQMPWLPVTPPQKDDLSRRQLLPPGVQPSQTSSLPVVKISLPPRGHADVQVASGQDDDNWTYGIDVWPVELPDPQRNDEITRHFVDIDLALRHKNINYGLSLLQHPADPIYFRRYILPRRYRDHESVRLDFLQVFNAHRPYNRRLREYRFTMSVVYESRQFSHGDNSYPAIADLEGDEVDPTGVRFGDHDVADLAVYHPPTADSFSPEPHDGLNLSPVAAAAAAVAAAGNPQAASIPTRVDHPEHTPNSRSKPIPKPDRDVKKNDRGKFVCTWQECAEDIKEFNRRCEWNKHMDKHERPYRCPIEGCEKLPGFTYSGGLLRHEREVHGKHGGPRNPLNCPHVNCKRHTGKGFSRLENLNEHLRRVHTSDAPISADEGQDDNVSVATNDAPSMLSTIMAGEKRKAEDDDEFRGELKRLRHDNQSLAETVRKQAAELQGHAQQAKVMMQQMQEMQSTIRQLRAGQQHQHITDLTTSSSLLDDASPFS